MPVPFLSAWLRRPPAPKPVDPARDKKASLRLEALESRDVPSTFDLGAANNFSAFFFGDFQSSYSDVEGRLAVGGNATITGYGIGDKLGSAGGNTLEVGGNLNLSNGQVNFGNIAVGGDANIAQNVGIPHGSVTDDLTVDFQAASEELKQKSADWANLTANGSVQNNWGTLRLTGTNAGLNVFHLSAAQLASANGLEINTPAGSQVLINVSGTNVTMQNFAIWINGTDKSNVLFNFHQAQNLTMQAIGIPASILAPHARVMFNNGQLNGTLIADSFCGNGQINYVPPTTPPKPPAPPCPCPEANAKICGKVVVHNPCGCPKPAPCVEVVLKGCNCHGSVSLTIRTNSDGVFVFPTLLPGTYSLTINVPQGHTLKGVEIGNGGGTLEGNTIVGIQVAEGQTLSGYKFTLEKVAAPVKHSSTKNNNNNNQEQMAAAAAQANIQAAWQAYVNWWIQRWLQNHRGR